MESQLVRLLIDVGGPVSVQTCGWVLTGARPSVAVRPDPFWSAGDFPA
jgi:hypothetical protein